MMCGGCEALNIRAVIIACAKRAGTGSRRLNAWERVFDSLSEAEKHYERIVRDKTNRQWRSPRKYRAIVAGVEICPMFG